MSKDNYSKEGQSYNTTEQNIVLDNNDVGVKRHIEKNKRSTNAKFSYQTVPYIIYGIYPNHTVVQKFPNGSRVLDTKLLTLNSTDPITNSSRNTGVHFRNR